LLAGEVGIAVLVLALRLPGAAPARHRPRPGPAVDNEPYRAFRQVAEQLSWAEVSPRHYDVVTRPLLTRLAAARLADRHRVDLVLHGHAHRGTERGRTPGGIPVRNVAQAVIQQGYAVYTLDPARRRAAARSHVSAAHQGRQG
jgi:hypothetical protein